MNGKSLVNVLLLTFFLWAGGEALADDPDSSPTTQIATEQVDINTADAETLQRVLRGVGRSRAEAIVAYRKTNGRFYSAEELTAVKGIGSSTLTRNEKRILVD